MTSYDLLRAIGETDERYLAESERYSERPRIIRKWAVSAASILLLTSLVMIPVKNGTFGCASAGPPDDHEHVFYVSLEKFIEQDGRDSLLANLSYEEEDITNFTMECVYEMEGDSLSNYYCSFDLADREGVTVKIAFSGYDRRAPEGEIITLCGEELILSPLNESRTRLYYTTPEGLYTITVKGEDHEEIALQVAQDLLTEEGKE